MFTETGGSHAWALFPLESDAKVRQNIKSKVKSFGFEKSAKQVFLLHVLTLIHRFDPMIENAERVLTLYAYLVVKTNNRLLTL